MAYQRIHFIELTDHLGPGFGGHISRIIFNEDDLVVRDIHQNW